MTGLSPDVVRVGSEIQQVYADLMQRVAAEVAMGIPGDEQQSKKLEKAWAFLTTLIGALTVARAVGSDALASSICDAGKAAALAAIGLTSH